MLLVNLGLQLTHSEGLLNTDCCPADPDSPGLRWGLRMRISNKSQAELMPGLGPYFEKPCPESATKEIRQSCTTHSPLGLGE